jgi:hypothetical protein
VVLRGGVRDHHVRAVGEPAAYGRDQPVRVAGHGLEGKDGDGQPRLLPQQGDHVGGVDRRPRVSSHLGLLEPAATEQLHAPDGLAAGGRVGGGAEHNDPRSVTGRGDLVEDRTGGRADVAAQGRVDPVAHQLRRPAGPDGGHDPVRRCRRLEVTAVGGDDDDVEPGHHLRHHVGALGHAGGDGAEAGPREPGGGRVRSGQVVRDDEDVDHRQSTAPAISTSGSEASHTAVVMPDQPRRAAVPSSPVNRVTTQK